MTLCIITIGSVLFVDYERFRTDLENSQIRLVNLVTTSLQNAFGTIHSQISALAREGYLINFINDPESSSAMLSARYRSITSNALVIEQIQLLSRDGRELVRVETSSDGARIVDESELTTQVSEQYFLEAMELSADQRYVTDLEFLTQNGQAVEPSRPVMTFSQPLFDQQNERWGVLAVRINAQPLLEAVQAVAVQASGELWMLNRDGEWLDGSVPEDEWALMYPERSERNLAVLDPQLWQKLESEAQAGFAHAGDVYIRMPVCLDLSCRITYNLNADPRSPVPLDPASSWFIVLRIPAELLTPYQLMLPHARDWLPLALLLMIIAAAAAMVSWRLASAVGVLRGKEEQLIQLNDELQAERQTLERRVTERTKALATARETAEAANRAKSSFLATMSHEIRTPMNGVIGSIDVLRQSSLNGRQLEQTALIRDSAYSLLAIIDDILDFSKIEAGRIQLESERVVIAYLVETVCSALLPVADGRNVDLSFYRSPALPSVILSDALRLRQIITNLVGNAIKFSSQQGHKGRVEVRVEAGASNTMVVSICDNGIGMKPEAIDSVFDPFCQADASTTRRFGGTGLGLAITRRLVEVMQGTITVESQVDVGSTFTVTLPLLAVEDGTPAADTAALAGYRCLLVTSSARRGYDWCDWLRHLGATVETSSSLEAAGQSLSDARSDGDILAVIVVDESVRDRELEQFAAFCERRPDHVVAVRYRVQRNESAGAEGFVCVNRHPSHARTVDRVLALLTNQTPEPQDDELVANANTLEPVARAQAIVDGRMILVAEDNEINQAVIRNQLDLLGYACDVAANGRDALELWTQNPSSYSMLLTDLHMPIMDGYELTAAIRSQEVGRSRRLPIVAFTANATRGEENHCLEAGMDDYLTKPLPLETLKGKLESWSKLIGSGPGKPFTPVAPAKKAEIFDRQCLALHVGEDAQRIRHFLKLYLESAKQGAEAVEACSAAADWKQLEAQAHKLKSSSLAVGALALAELCQSLETAVKTDKLQDLPEVLDSFRHTLEVTLKQIAVDAEGYANDVEAHPNSAGR